MFAIILIEDLDCKIAEQKYSLILFYAKTEQKINQPTLIMFAAIF
jgi:hypothetical protein